MKAETGGRKTKNGCFLDLCQCGVSKEPWNQGEVLSSYIPNMTDCKEKPTIYLVLSKYVRTFAALFQAISANIFNKPSSIS